MKITITDSPTEMREAGIIEAFIKGLTGCIQIRKVKVLPFRGRLLQDTKQFLTHKPN